MGSKQTSVEGLIYGEVTNLFEKMPVNNPGLDSPFISSQGYSPARNVEFGFNSPGPPTVASFVSVKTSQRGQLSI